MSEEQQQAANFFCKYCNTTLLGWLEADSHAEVCPSNSNSGLASGGTLPEQDGASSDEFEGVVDELELEDQAEEDQAEEEGNQAWITTWSACHHRQSTPAPGHRH